MKNSEPPKQETDDEELDELRPVESSLLPAQSRESEVDGSVDTPKSVDVPEFEGLDDLQTVAESLWSAQEQRSEKGAAERGAND